MANTQYFTWISEYRKYNDEYVTELTRVIHEIESVRDWGEHEEKKIIGNKEKLKNLLSSLKGSDSVRAIELSNNLIELLNKESTALSEYLRNINPEEIEAVRQFEKVIQNYEDEKLRLEQKLASIFGNLFSIGERTIIEHGRALETSAKSFIDYYKELEEYILTDKPNKGGIFWKIDGCINYLKAYLPLDNSIHREDIKELLNHLDGNAKKFVSNFFAAGEEFFREYSEKKKLFDGNDGEERKAYSGLGDDEEKADKFLKKILESLFSGIKKSKGGKSIQDKIKAISFVNNLKELADGFKALKRQLQDKISNKKLNYRVGSEGFEGIKFAKQDGTGIKIGDLDKKFLEDDDNKATIEFVIGEIEGMLSNDAKFKDIIHTNGSIFTTLTGNNGSVSSRNIDEDIDFSSITNLLQSCIGEIQARDLQKANTLRNNVLSALFNLQNDDGRDILDIEYFKELVSKARNLDDFNSVDNSTKNLVLNSIIPEIERLKNSITESNFNEWLTLLENLLNAINRN